MESVEEACGYLFLVVSCPPPLLQLPFRPSPPLLSPPAGLTEGEAGVAHIHFVGLDSDPLTGEVYAASIPVHKVSLSRFHTSQSPHFVAV